MRSETQKKKKSRLLFFVLSFLLLFLFIGSFFLIYMVTLDIPLSRKISQKINDENLLKLAEKSYNDGYLENSAIYYRDYLETNPKKLSKIKVYEKMFEIGVVRNNFEEALNYLQLWEKIDPNNPKILIQKIKLLFRMEAFQQIKTEIDENYHKFKKSTEFKELISVYFIETSKIEKALKVLNEIPYNKREFRVHQKFIYCYLKLDKIKEALEYVKKIERKVRFFEIKEHKIEFSLLKAIAFILSGDYIFAEMELRNLSVNEKNKNLFFKTLLYCNIKLDREEEITELIEKDESLILDPEYYKILGDYYLYKRNYENSLKFYRIIERKRELTKLETMTLSDIYYRLSDYKNSVNTIKVLKNDYKCESPDIYRNLSLNLFLLGDASNGFFSLKEGIDKFPLDIDLYVRLGKYFIEYGDYNAALKTVDEALQIVKNNKKAVYDKRLDIIKLISMEKNNPNIKEFDFLELREKNNKNPEYYFKTIEYYVKSKKFTDAYREIENISALPLNKTQFEILNIYKLIYADNTENKELYEETKKELLKSQKEKIETKINTAIVYILDEDYDNALDIMNQIDIKLINNFLKNKIFYLKAIVYYMKKDYAVSYKLLQNVIENNKDDPKAPFIKSLIEKEYGDKN